MFGQKVLAADGGRPSLPKLMEPSTFEWSGVHFNGSVYFWANLIKTVYLEGAGNGAVYLVRPELGIMAPEYSFLYPNALIALLTFIRLYKL